jgi:cell division protein FtsL
VAGWDAAAAVEASPAPQPRARPSRPRPAPRQLPRPRVYGGVVWIVFLALLLTGVVAMNVAVLRLNMRLDELGQERANLRAENHELQSQISSGATLSRVQTLARTRLGLQVAEPGDTGYVRLGR